MAHIQGQQETKPKKLRKYAKHVLASSAKSLKRVWIGWRRLHSAAHYGNNAEILRLIRNGATTNWKALQSGLLRDIRDFGYIDRSETVQLINLIVWIENITKNAFMKSFKECIAA